jgi:iron-sulfur cluster assembly protein
VKPEIRKISKRNTMENTKESIVRFTTGAEKQLTRLAKEQNPDSPQKLRIGVEGGGCAGLSYILKYDSVNEGDIDMNINGIAFIMNKAHSLYLSGVLIDFAEGLSARGFTFQNPNAETTCGCGSSFSI